MFPQTLKIVSDLLNLLHEYQDAYSTELKAVLKDFIIDPRGQVVDKIESITVALPAGGYRMLYADFDIILYLSELFWPVASDETIQII